MIPLAERLEDFRRDVPGAAGVLVGLVVDNPAQFAMVASGAYVVTRALARVVRPYGVAGYMMTAAASYGVCWWLLGEARRRGVLVFRVRDSDGELVTLDELAEREAARGEAAFTAAAAAFAGKSEPGPLVDLDALEREVARRATSPG